MKTHMEHDWWNLNPGYLDDMFECKRCGISKAFEEDGRAYYFRDLVPWMKGERENYVEPPCAERD